MPPAPLALSVTPSGALLLGHDAAQSPAALLSLASASHLMPQGPERAFALELSGRFLARLAATPDVELLRHEVDVPFGESGLDALAASAPPMLGGEYMSVEVLERAWRDLLEEARRELRVFPSTVADWLHAKNPAYGIVGRVCFHLAENKQDRERPFAFLATYAVKTANTPDARHAPLGRALEEYAGAGKQTELVKLLGPVLRAAEQCKLIHALVENGEIYHPLAWTADEALAFLQEAENIKAAGVVVKMPDFLRQLPRPGVTVTLGKAPPGGVGADAMLDFDASLTLDGERLTAAERRAILEGTDGLVLLKGRWVEVDRERLKATLDRWAAAQRAVDQGGVSFTKALRMLSGLSDAGDDTAPDRGWTRVVAGKWLDDVLADLRQPGEDAALDPGKSLNGTLRGYQRQGVSWMFTLARLGLGACLADDMGLGKTIQVIALLLALRKKKVAGPHLLVLPASLLGNWTSELDRFAPSLSYVVAHASAVPSVDLRVAPPPGIDDADLVITTYGTATRATWMGERRWGLVIADEAQALKNPGAKQTRAVKAIPSMSRIALTGTPIENNLGDLWSLFDFLSPGLLGSATEFRAMTKRIEQQPEAGFVPLRAAVRPYLLRRMKSDKSIVADLPDKTEMLAHCRLTKAQASHYSSAVDELAMALASSTGMKRRGLVLAYLMRLKQICNHPSQWLGDQAWKPADSGKFDRLRELCEPIAARQEKVLVFSQFQETTTPLARFLATVFGRDGLVLSGETPVKQRRALVESFQHEQGPPFFVLSVKAGGTGLNLTAASHVIHFDRWWNPAVEAQATDRAYRIGQKKNVLVHKFVCRGTIEEKIDAMLTTKRGLADKLFDGAGEAALTELGNDELLRLVSLDLRSALAEG